jgi:hypothetical protein
MPILRSLDISLFESAGLKVSSHGVTVPAERATPGEVDQGEADQVTEDPAGF